VDGKEEKEMLQRIADSLERIAANFDVIAEKCRKESAEDFYKRHGITQTFS